jgi:dihydroneopterin aldolase
MDKIIINGARFQAHVGVSEEERRRMQAIVVDLQALVDTRAAGHDDDPDATVNYVEVHEAIKRTIAARSFRLIEAIAEEIAAEVLRRSIAVAGVVVRVTKPAAMGDRGVSSAAVEITRMRHE